jgi:transcriptional regulator with XRE-family HTH domain
MATTEFGQAVHRWRDRISPEAAGLPVGGRRRAAGLRREELALLAGISVDYITRLEQGRAANPSAQVVEALTRALRLSATERAHLVRLAGLAPPGPETVPAYITPSVQRMLDRLTGTPVGVYDASWTLLIANPPYAALVGDPSGWRGNQRNAVWRHCANNDRFAELWDSGTVGRHEAARKTIDHPHVGPPTLDCDVLTVAGSDLRIMIYTAEPGTEDADRLALLTVLGTQTLVG